MERLLYSEPFKIEDSDVPYRCIAEDYVEVGDFEGHRILKIHYEGLVFLSETAFTDMAYLLRSSHLKRLQEILSASDSSKNDRYVALELIKNAVIASSRLFPLCQDTGTAIVFGKKGQTVWTRFNDREALSRGIFNAYTKNPLRYSQLIPLSMFDEKNSGNNLPAQIEIEASGGNRYSFLFIAKGGGSSNKTY
ncbi:MAG TPA: fumarate hydratase, partial [Desulfobacteraceae bacterium]|nr:fumarate hydratase [Desulfobacteraceae bacterium]